MEIQVVIWQTTFENLTKVRAARAARLFLVIQPMRSLFSGVVVAVAVVLACNRELWHQRRERQQQQKQIKNLIGRVRKYNVLHVRHAL